MAGFCGKCKLNFEGSKCPVCGRHKNTIPIVMVSIIGIVVLAGVFGYSNYSNEIESFVDNTKNSIQDFTKETTEIQNVNEEHETTQEWKNIMKKEYTFTDSTNQNLIESTQITESDIEKIRLEFHELVNDERKKVGVEPLTLDPKINSIAQNYVNYLSEHNHFAHEDLDGNRVSERFESVGYDCNPKYPNWYKAVGENLGTVFLNSENKALDMLNGLKNSKKHYDNAMNENFVREGLGFAVGEEWFIMVQNFC